MLSDALRRACANAGGAGFADDWVNGWDPAKWVTSSVGSGTAQFDTLNGTGRIISTYYGRVGMGRAASLWVPTSQEYDLLLQCTQAATSVYFNVRASGGWFPQTNNANALLPYDGLSLEVKNTGAQYIREVVNGTLPAGFITGPYSGPPPSATVPYWVRLRVQGGSVMVRTWPVGSSEPTTWPLIRNLLWSHPGGGVQLGVYASGSTGEYVLFDNLTITTL